MNLVASIAIVLTQLPVPKVDQAEPDRDRRLYSIAVAIDRAAERATCTGDYAVEPCKPIASDAGQVAAELIVLANEETALRRNVHADHCLDHQCDPTRSRIKGVVYITHRARSLWQLHRAPIWTAEKWDGLAGLSQEATDNSAWEATKLMAGGHGACKTTAGAFAYYAGNRYCLHKSAEGRAARVVVMRGRLAKLMRQTEPSKPSAETGEVARIETELNKGEASHE